MHTCRLAILLPHLEGTVLPANRAKKEGTSSVGEHFFAAMLRQPQPRVPKRQAALDYL
jgi:hypothetical protein